MHPLYLYSLWRLFFQDMSLICKNFFLYFLYFSFLLLLDFGWGFFLPTMFYLVTVPPSNSNVSDKKDFL